MTDVSSGPQAATGSPAAGAPPAQTAKPKPAAQPKVQACEWAMCAQNNYCMHLMLAHDTHESRDANYPGATFLKLLRS